MSVWQRVLRVAVPTALLGAFVAWLFLTPSDAPPTALSAAPGSLLSGSKGRIPLQAADAGVQSLLEKAVKGQIGAFKKGDYRSALQFSTAGFRQGITPDRFREIITTSYEQMRACKKVTCLPAQSARDAAAMGVTVQGSNGVTAFYLYHFVLEEGQWRIAAVDFPPRHPRDREGNPLPAGIRAI